MGIKKIVLENWKSYAGTHTIPVQKFSAIIGPNGAGKSNLMDAISFVLGVNSSKLRGNKISDVIHRKDVGEENKEPKSAFVELLFESEVGENKETITFKRHVRSSGSSLYYLNQKVVKLEEYNDKLKKIGVLIKSRNFLVFQGDIESVASKTPKDLTSLIEEVSGSSDLIKDYKQAVEGKKLAEKELASHFNRRKTILKEKRQILQQKNEAENYKELIEKLRSSKKDLYFEQHKEYEQRIKVLESKENKANDLKDLIEVNKNNALMVKETIKEKKKLISNLHSEKEKENSLKDSIESILSEKIQFEEKHEFLSGNVQSLDKTLVRVKRARIEHRQRINEFSKELKEIEKKVKEFEKEQNLNQKGSDNVFKNEKAKNEFYQLESEFNIKSKLEIEELKSLKTLTNKFDEKLQNLTEKKNVLLQRIKSHREAAENCSELIQNLKSEVEGIDKESFKLKPDIKKYDKSNEGRKKRKTELKQKIKTAEETLNSIHFSRSVSQRDKKRIDNFNTLKEAFGDSVKGFVIDLIKPISPKYRIAVIAAMGVYNTDAIVVDTEKTGFECIRVLKERRLGSAVFFPLDSLKTKPLKTDYRKIDRDVRLLVDIVNCRNEYRKLAAFVFGSSLYAESLEKAREVCFKRKEYRNKVKAITKEGDIISKNGNMTGGKTTHFAQQLKRFDESEAQRLEKRIFRFVTELEELEDENYNSINEKRQKLNMITERKKWIEIEIKSNEEILKKDEEKILLIEKELKENKEKLLSTDKSKSDLHKKKNKSENQINSSQKEHFSAFIKKYEIVDFKSFMCRLKGFTEELAKRKMKLYDERNSLKDKLEFEKGKNFDKEYKETENEFETEKNKLQQVEKKMKFFDDKVSKLKDKTEKIKSEISQLQQRLDKNGKTSKKIDLKNSELAEKISFSKKETAEREMERENIEAFKKDIVIRAELDEIDFEEFIAERESKRSRDRKERPAERIKKVKKEVESIEKEISKICPNLRSFEHYKNLEKKALETNKEFHSVKAKCQNQIKVFKEIEEKRTELFLKGFNHIENEINNIYKQMTKSNEFPMGGNAYLTLENSDCQPFIHGTFFSAMPPSKRFREIESLSGGEKSVAALALLFAVHSFRPAPFFILDEVDAALDSSNVQNVVKYIEERTRKENFQCLVISLKINLYHRADTLVGVYKHADKGSSGILTLDLGKVHGENKKARRSASAIAQRDNATKLSVSSFDSDTGLP